MYNVVNTRKLAAFLIYETYFFRSENKETLKKVLSEDSKQRRRRRNTVNLQMTIFAWSLEFVAGIVNLFVGIETWKNGNIDFITYMVIFDGFLNFIIIPSSYLLNNEVTKTAIYVGGWIQTQT